MRDVQAKKLGTRLKKAREAQGRSARDVAKAVGIHYSTLSYLEKGVIARPNVKTLQALSRELEVELDDLYEVSGYAKPESLPELRVYLRTKYKLGPVETAEIEQHFKRLRERRNKRRGSSARTS